MPEYVKLDICWIFACSTFSVSVLAKTVILVVPAFQDRSLRYISDWLVHVSRWNTKVFLPLWCMTCRRDQSNFYSHFMSLFENEIMSIVRVYCKC